MVVEIEHMAGIGRRQSAMTADNQHVLVIVVRRAETEIVRTSHHGAIVAERIDHHDLVVNDREAEFGEFRLPGAENVIGRDGAGGNRTRVRLEFRLLRALFFGFPGSPTTVTFASWASSSSSPLSWSECPP
jgi:hypothetical protein